MKKYENEEDIKIVIFDIFSKCRNEPSSDRRQTYFMQLCEQIYKWCRDYLTFNIDEMGLEITKITKRFIKDDIIDKIPYDKDSFFKYLTTSLNRGKIEYYRNNEFGLIKIPRDRKSKLKEQEYLDLLDKMKVVSISLADRDSEIADIHNDPLDDYLLKSDTETLREAVKSVLYQKQERARKCTKALFTLHCIKKLKNIEGLYPILDREILEACQTDKKQPKQYEIYMKYHPGADKDSSEAIASKILKDFLNDLKVQLKENNP